MVRSKTDRTGEENVNNFGSKMIISRYNNTRDIDVYFPEYDWTINHVTYGAAFKKGKIKCPYEPRVHGKGYLGENKYKASENGKKTKCYKVWQKMLQRCYDDFKKRRPSYKDCEVCTEWHNFQNFAEWYNDNYYQIEDEVMNLDKDILVKGNKIYSPETCVFVPQNINTLFIKCDKSRGDYPIGVCYNKQNGKYIPQCNVCNSKSRHLGCFDNPEEAFQVYKQYKEKYIKEVIDSYEGIIPEPHYSKLKNAIYNYKVEITD